MRVRTALAQVLLAGLLHLPDATCIARNEPGLLPPEGKPAGIVQFDAILEMRPHQGASDTLLFARYWVSADSYQVAMIWNEPHWRSVAFAGSPEGLRIGSDPQSFHVRSDIATNLNRSFAKPLSHRDPFHYRYGDYTVLDSRFAELEANQSRLFKSDLIKHPDQEESGGPTFWKLPAQSRQIGSVKANGGDGSHPTVELFDRGGDLIRRITYDRSDPNQSESLRSVHVEIPARPQSLVLGGQGVRVKIAGESYQITNLAGQFPGGDRSCDVEYQRLTLGGTAVALPSRIDVREVESKRLYRSARLFNYKPVQMAKGDIQRLAEEYAGSSREVEVYQKLMTENWPASTNRIARTNRNEIIALIRAFESVYSSHQDSVGEKLRAINALMDLNRLAGRKEETTRWFRTYLDTLAGSGFQEMILVGGSAAIDNSLVFGELAEADSLLGEWLQKAMTVCSPESVREFAGKSLHLGNRWAVASLSGRALEMTNLPPDLRFELSAIRTVSLAQVAGILDAKEGSSSPISWNQKEWIKRLVQGPALGEMFAKSKRESQTAYEALTRPSEAQKSLKRQVDYLKF